MRGTMKLLIAGFGLILLLLAVNAGVSGQGPLVDTTASVTIDAPRERVWRDLQDFEGRWESSNPEHDGIWVLTSPKRPLRDGLRFLQRESVGGVTGMLHGRIYDVRPPRRFSWRARTRYTFFGLPMDVREGGSVVLAPAAGSVVLSHRVWAHSGPSLTDRILAAVAAWCMDLEADARQHTLVELAYFRDSIEAAQAVPKAHD
ncbi:hypothetical protein PC39_01080 [Salinisphaera sp. PC39]